MVENRTNNIYVFCGLGSFLILLTCIKVTHLFSSLYVLQAAPFFMVILSYHMKFSKMELMLRLAGIVMGIISLISYFRLGSATYNDQFNYLIN